MNPALKSKLSKDEVLHLFDCIAVWKRGGERAPHKPLLALLALARCINGKRRMMRYRRWNES